MVGGAFRVGLTGGIASGKSTVRRLLAAAGFETVDADQLVADLYRPGEAGAAAVKELFGEAYLTDEGAVDHQALAALVFAADDTRKKLEEAIHPLVRRRFAEMATAAAASQPGAVVVLEASLLVEAGYAPDFHLVVTVEARKEVRIARAVARGASESEALSRLEAQGDGELRRSHADRVLRNDGDLGALEGQVDELVDEIRRLAYERRANKASSEEE
ncbi:MAG: dephospho-CoA kinase [Acidobacteriota bacterium]|nr:dephospho-CoA kinase [Acidobacteriota bacterium]